MPAHVIDGLVAPEIQGEVAAALHLVEQLFADVTDHIAEGIDEHHTAPQAVFLDNGLHQRPVNHVVRSEEHTSELQSLMRISYAVFCLQKKKPQSTTRKQTTY